MKEGRIKLWVDREIQVKFVVYALISLALACAIVSIATFYTIWADLSAIVSRSGQDIEQIYAASFRKFVLTTFFLVLLLAALSTLGMMLLSHRVAGPVYRIKTILKDLREGKRPAFALRKGDAMKPLLEELQKLDAQHNTIANSALDVIQKWKKTEVQDISLNLAIEELQNKLVHLSLEQERERGK